MLEENFEPSMQPFAIYNDGLPNSVYAGLHPEHEIVSHIPDEAIDEIFPASAEDVSLCNVEVILCNDAYDIMFVHILCVNFLLCISYVLCPITHAIQIKHR